MRHVLLACTLMLFGGSAAAQPADFTLTIGDGRVTLIADGVPARTILQEWARVGQSQIVNVEKVSGPPLTLRLLDVPEEHALDVVLRSVSGYVAAPRATAVGNASRFDRILILASSHPTAAAPVPPPAFPQQRGFPQPGMQPGMPPPGMPQPGMMPEPVEIQDDQVDDGTMPTPPIPQDLPVASPQPGPLPLTHPGAGGIGDGQQPQPQQPQLPTTAPRPGVITPTGQPQQPGPVKPPDSLPIR